MSTSEGAGTHINTLMQLTQRMFSSNVSSSIRKLLQFQRTYSEYLFTNDLFWKCLVTTKATIFIQLTKYTSQFTSQLPKSDTSISLPLPPPPNPVLLGTLTQVPFPCSLRCTVVAWLLSCSSHQTTTAYQPSYVYLVQCMPHSQNSVCEPKFSM